MYAIVNDTHLFFDIEGSGFVPEGPKLREKPTCFVLHGGPGGDHTVYKPHLTPLSDLMQLVYIDNRGSGFSECQSSSTYTLNQNVEDLEALRKYLGLKKIVLMGQSYGGMVALSYAVAYPQNVSSLLLITTSPSFNFIEKAKKIVSEKGTNEQQKMAQILWNGEFESQEQLTEYYKVMEPLYSFSFNPKPTQLELQKRTEAYQSSNRSFKALNAGFKGFLKTYNVIGQLKSIKCPTLIIAGRHDWITPVEESFVLAEKIPDNELVIFEKSSHNVIKDEYKHFISTVTSFVEKRLIYTVQNFI
ncbi:alpha/beta fold hydrolase [Fictibacillus enclensis]|uniref:alpha/beta fold hydrolase n=1 Tax=Fictibacillus enclensis TaxID=1017270 RepID=UPI00259FFD8A|nr:alpha/beta fold hydrolase [Fictibacillus enclensis]MDM5196682.1 alpha/beta fold hydrolase [Fictibacillus enclensis]